MVLQLSQQTKDRDDPVTLDNANSRTVFIRSMDMEGVGLGSKLALTKVHYIESQLMKILKNI